MGAPRALRAWAARWFRPGAAKGRIPAEPRAAGRLAKRRVRRPGFTLIELLVAIGLLASILALVFGAFSQISGGAASVRNQVEDQQTLRFLAGLIVDDLAATQYLGQLAKKNLPTGIAGKREYVMNGQFTRIDFHAAVPARFNRQLPPEQDPELHEIGYRVRLSKDRQRLELARREDFYLDDDFADGGIEAPLVGNVKEFRVEFLGVPEQPALTESEENWLEAWDSQEQGNNGKLPRSIRVTLTLTGKDGLPLSETLVANIPMGFERTAETEAEGETQPSDPDAIFKKPPRKKRP